jgi:hypothetical protein
MSLCLWPRIHSATIAGTPCCNTVPVPLMEQHYRSKLSGWVVCPCLLWPETFLHCKTWNLARTKDIHKSWLINRNTKLGMLYSTDFLIPTAETANMPQVVLADAQYRHALRHHRKRASCWANPCQGGGTCLNGPHPSKPMLCICPPDREGKKTCEMLQWTEFKVFLCIHINIYLNNILGDVSWHFINFREQMWFIKHCRGSMMVTRTFNVLRS